MAVYIIVSVMHGHINIKFVRYVGNHTHMDTVSRDQRFELAVDSTARLSAVYTNSFLKTALSCVGSFYFAIFKNVTPKVEEEFDVLVIKTNKMHYFSK